MGKRCPNLILIYKGRLQNLAWIWYIYIYILYIYIPWNVMFYGLYHGISPFRRICFSGSKLLKQIPSLSSAIQVHFVWIWLVFLEGSQNPPSKKGHPELIVINGGTWGPYEWLSEWVCLGSNGAPKKMESFHPKLSHEEKPWLVGLYRELYYPII